MNVKMMWKWCSLLVLAGSWSVAGWAQTAGTASNRVEIVLDDRSPGRMFDGIGALSAGASSRLLIDYPEPQRSEILDYLFKPNFGAALQINKVEIGGDMNSTDGSEPSHMRTRDEENYQRGYEWWLMEESKKRNPAIHLSALEWGAPGWVNLKQNWIFTQDNIHYILKWLRGAKDHHNLTIDSVGGWNEKGRDADWSKKFRAALNKEGFGAIKVISDDSVSWEVGKTLSADPAFAASFEVVGIHYPSYGTIPTLPKYRYWKFCHDSGKPIWGSEIGSAKYHGGASKLAQLYNQGYINYRMTAYINWSTVWSVLPGLPFAGCGLMLANQPWSGHYEVGKSIWATAHTTQFAQPGWRYLDQSCALLVAGNVTNGSHVALLAPNGKDYSVIVETIGVGTSQPVSIKVGGSLAAGPLHVWRTDLRSDKPEAWFVKQNDLAPEGNVYAVTLEAGCLYSFTTTTGQSKGTTTPPPSAILALPYREDFQRYAAGATPKYFSDQHGTFEVAPAGGGRQGQCLRQTVTVKPVCWNRDADPATMIGDGAWSNYLVRSDVLLEKPGYAALIGRMMGTRVQNHMTGYHLRLTDTGHWSLVVVNDPNRKDQKEEEELAVGCLPAATGTGTWHRLGLEFVSSNITASIDGQVVAGVKNATYCRGLVGYQANRWQTAQFMNFEALPAGSADR